MSWDLFGEGGTRGHPAPKRPPGVGPQDRGRIRALKMGSVGPVMSDLQNILEDERKHHMDAYRYAHGHNDHGLGQ